MRTSSPRRPTPQILCIAARAGLEDALHLPALRPGPEGRDPGHATDGDGPSRRASTDALFREGKSGQVHDFLKAAHDLGTLAGVSAHNPDCIKQIADEGWEADFFMTCFYFLTRTKKPETGAKSPRLLDGPTVGYPFYAEDPLVMTRVARQVKQPCLGFKILGAGRMWR